MKLISASALSLIMGLAMTACTQQKAESAPVSVDTSAMSAHESAHDHEAADQSVMVKADLNVAYALTPAPDDHVIGNAAAPNVLMVYASVTCPHCAHWFNTEWPSFKTAYVDTGKVKFIFREFPTQPSQLAVSGFMIANCAGEDKFFDNLFYQFKNQEQYFQRFKDGDGEKAFMEQANHAGLKTQADVEKCFKQDDKFMRITKSMDRAEAAGIQGVPGFILNGSVYSGSPTAVDLGKAVDSGGK